MEIKCLIPFLTHCMRSLVNVSDSQPTVQLFRRIVSRHT